MKVILPAQSIPDGSTVTKVTGRKLCKLVNTVKIYGEHKEEVVVQGCKFLISDGNINAIPALTELIWIVEELELLRYLEDIYSE